MKANILFLAILTSALLTFSCNKTDVPPEPTPEIETPTESEAEEESEEEENEEEIEEGLGDDILGTYKGTYIYQHHYIDYDTGIMEVIDTILDATMIISEVLDMTGVCCPINCDKQTIRVIVLQDNPYERQETSWHYCVENYYDTDNMWSKDDAGHSLRTQYKLIIDKTAQTLTLEKYNSYPGYGGEYWDGFYEKVE